MITYTCEFCGRALEVDDDLAGKQVACPFCAKSSVAPMKSAVDDGTPVARAARSQPWPSPPPPPPPGSSAEARKDRAEKMGLPPDHGPEQDVVRLHPVMLRARPMAGALLILIAACGLVATVFGLVTLLVPVWIGGIVGIAAAGVWWVAWWVMSLSVQLTITNKRTQLRRGLLSRSTREVLHDRVQDIQVEQTFLQRVLSTGSIGVSSSGESNVEIVVDDMPDPVRLRDIIDAYREIG